MGIGPVLLSINPPLSPLHATVFPKLIDELMSPHRDIPSWHLPARRKRLVQPPDILTRNRESRPLVPIFIDANVLNFLRRFCRDGGASGSETVDLDTLGLTYLRARGGELDDQLGCFAVDTPRGTGRVFGAAAGAEVEGEHGGWGRVAAVETAD